MFFSNVSQFRFLAFQTVVVGFVRLHNSLDEDGKNELLSTLYQATSPYAKTAAKVKKVKSHLREISNNHPEPNNAPRNGDDDATWRTRSLSGSEQGPKHAVWELVTALIGLLNSFDIGAKVENLLEDVKKQAFR
jgi:hypothetical protein